MRRERPRLTTHQTVGRTPWASRSVPPAPRRPRSSKMMGRSATSEPSTPLPKPSTLSRTGRHLAGLRDRARGACACSPGDTVADVQFLRADRGGSDLPSHLPAPDLTDQHPRTPSEPRDGLANQRNSVSCVAREPETSQPAPVVPLSHLSPHGHRFTSDIPTEPCVKRWLI